MNRTMAKLFIQDMENYMDGEKCAERVRNRERQTGRERVRKRKRNRNRKR